MAEGFKIASAFVTVEPDAAGFAEKLRAQIGDPTAKVRVENAGADAAIDHTSEKLRALGAQTARPKVDSSGTKDAAGWMGLLVSAAVAVAPAAITAGTGVAAFGALATPTLAKVAQYQQLLNTRTAAGQKQAQAMWSSMDSGQRQVALSYQSLATSYHSFAKELEPQVIRDVDDALRVAQKILPSLATDAEAGGKAVGGLINQFGGFLQGGQGQQFFAFVAQQAGPDLHALGNLLTGVSSGVFGLTEALNPLAKIFINTAGDVAAFVGDLSRAAPWLVQTITLATMAGFAGAKLAAAWTALKETEIATTIMGWVSGLGELVTASIAAAAVDQAMAAAAVEDAAAMTAFAVAADGTTVAVTSLTAAETALAVANGILDAAAPMWLIAGTAVAVVGALVFGLSRLSDGSQRLVADLTAQYHATGYNVQGYQHLAGALGQVAAGQQAAASSLQGSKFALAGNVISQAADKISVSQQQAETHARNLNAALAALQTEYGLSRGGAIRLAEAAGAQASKLAAGGDAAQKTMDQIAGYVVQGAQASDVTTQLAVGWGIAADSAQTLTARVQGLNNSFAALIDPQLAVMNDTVSFRQQETALAKALTASAGELGTHTLASEAATKAVYAAAKGAETLSGDILQNTGSSVKAIAPLQALVNQMVAAGVHGAGAASLIARLRREIAGLRSKNIAINVAVQETGLSSGGLPVPHLGGHHFQAAEGAVIPGYAPGRDTRWAQVSPGESILVPELTRAIGPDKIMAANAAYSRGRSRGNKTGQFSGGGLVSAFSTLGAGQLNVYLNVQGTDPAATAAVIAALGGKSAASKASAFHLFQDTGLRLADAFAGASKLTAAQIKAEAASAVAEIRRYYTGPAQQRLTAAVSRQAGALERLATQSAKITARIAAEKSYAANITSSLGSYSALSSLTAPAAGETPRQLGQSLRTQLAAKLATLHLFFTLITRLKRAKADRSLIGQVIALGPDQGVQYAQAILAGGGKLIRELNAEESQLGALDRRFGQRAAEIHFGQSISKGFLSGLRADRARLEREMRHLGDVLARELARDFGVPARDIRGLHHHHHQRHDRHDHRDHHQGGGQHHHRRDTAQAGHATGEVTVNLNYYGTQHPTHEQKSIMMRDLALALSGA